MSRFDRPAVHAPEFPVDIGDYALQLLMTSITVQMQKLKLALATLDPEAEPLDALSLARANLFNHNQYRKVLEQSQSIEDLRRVSLAVCLVFIEYAVHLCANDEDLELAKKCILCAMHEASDVANRCTGRHEVHYTEVQALITRCTEILTEIVQKMNQFEQLIMHGNPGAFAAAEIARYGAELSPARVLELIQIEPLVLGVRDAPRNFATAAIEYGLDTVAIWHRNLRAVFKGQ
jgi:hypothetical protein